MYISLNGTEVMNIHRSTVTQVKKPVETFEWILTKYAMESLNESGQFIWLYESDIQFNIEQILSDSEFCGRKKNPRLRIVNFKDSISLMM